MRFLSLLGLLSLAMVTLVMLGAVARAYFIGRRRRAAATFGAWLGMLAIYFTFLAGISLASREQVLAPGSEKRFCALDCDLAYAVDDVQRIDLQKPGRHELIVRLRVRSDARAVRMRPSDFRAWLTTSEGARIDPVTVPRPALLGDLAPGETRTMELQFEIPERAHGLRLAMVEGGWPTRLAIGDENSFLHRKTVFGLQERMEPRANSH